jgi:PAS domain S-box-containing protein
MSVAGTTVDGPQVAPSSVDASLPAALIRQVADQSPAVTLVVAGPDFRIVFANQAAHREARCAPGELAGQVAAAVFAFIDPASLVATPNAQARAVAARAGDATRWWDVSYVALDTALSEPRTVLITASDVTHHEIARLEARAAQDTLDALLAYIPQGISIAHGPEVRVDHISARGMALVGRSPDELTGQSALRQTDVWEVYRPGSDVPLSPADRPLARATRTGEMTLNETLIVRRPDGGSVTVLCNSGPIRDAAGAVTGAVMAWQDIGELQHAQAAMRESEERLRLVMDSTGLGAWEYDAIKRTTIRSARHDAIFGYAEPVSDWSHDRFKSHVHEDDRERAEAGFRAALEDGEDWNIQCRIIRTDGSSGWIHVRARPHYGTDGRIVRLLGTVADITERKQAEDAAIETAAKFETLAQTLPAMVWASLPDGQIDWFNARVPEYCGVPAEEMKPDGWAPVHPDDMERSIRLWQEALATGKPYVAEYRIRRHDGMFRWHITRAIPIRGADGAITRWIGASADIQDQKSSEEALAQLNATLEQQVRERTAELLEAEATLRQSQKMEAVGQLTGGLAHDFNNLLTGITGSLELMASRLDQGRLDDLGRYLEIARGAAQRAAALTHRLLAFSRRQTLDPKPTDMNQLVGGMDELIRRTVGPAVTVEVVAAPGLSAVLADPNQLENALLNLCLNARDAMPGGGRLIVETGNRILGDAEARSLELPAGQYVQLSVRDTGAGMTAEVIARAFDPFYTTKPIGEGTGLGLSMVYGFVRQSGGQAHIRSQPGQGAEVRLLLPRYDGECDAPEAPAAAPKAQRGDGRTVLVVDDEPSVRLLIREVLDELGYEIMEAETGAGGLEILQSGRRVDLLVTDVGLPGGMNGRQLADAALSGRADLKVLFITGYAEKAVIGDGSLKPPMYILTKPFSLETLGRCVEQIIAAP